MAEIDPDRSSPSQNPATHGGRSGLVIAGTAGRCERIGSEELSVENMRQTVEEMALTLLKRAQDERGEKTSEKPEEPVKAEKVKRVEKAQKAAKKSSPEPVETAEEPFFRGQNSPKKMRKVLTLEQWVEVTVEDGKTVTKVVPSNEELIARGKRMWPAPELIYRRFNFPAGIPEEYHWTQDDPVKRQFGGAGIQRMTVETWLQMREREKDNPSGHLGPTPEGNLPRPKERGGCDCEVCTRNLPLLAKWEASRTGRS